VSWVKLTSIILMISTAAIWAFWDIVPAVNKVSGDTISELMRIGARNSLLISAAIGILIGHFFWPNHHPLNIPWYIVIIILSLVGLTWLSFDIYHWINLKNINYHQLLIVSFLREYPIINFLFHIMVGYLVWSWKDL
jgi:hypothetical protein